MARAGALLRSLLTGICQSIVSCHAADAKACLMWRLQVRSLWFFLTGMRSGMFARQPLMCMHAKSGMRRGACTGLGFPFLAYGGAHVHVSCRLQMWRSAGIMHSNESDTTAPLGCRWPRSSCRSARPTQMRKPAAQSSAACRLSSRWVFICSAHCTIACTSTTAEQC